jgi:hypothetical protein
MKKEMPKMKNKTNQNAYNAELVALIKSGVKPEEAKKIADSHVGNYEKVVKQVAKERAEERELSAKQRQYADVLSARIKSGEKPSDVVEDMRTFNK